MVTDCEEMVNVPVVEPAGMVRLVGTDTPGICPNKLTVAPPVGAGASRVIVPTVELPPTSGLAPTEIRRITAAREVLPEAITSKKPASWLKVQRTSYACATVAFAGTETQAP